MSWGHKGSKQQGSAPKSLCLFKCVYVYALEANSNQPIRKQVLNNIIHETEREASQELSKHKFSTSAVCVVMAQSKETTQGKNQQQEHLSDASGSNQTDGSQKGSTVHEKRAGDRVSKYSEDMQRLQLWSPEPLQTPEFPKCFELTLTMASVTPMLCVVYPVGTPSMSEGH